MPFGDICRWHLIAVFALGLGTRVFPRIVCKEARGMDAFYHLLAARRIRERGFRYPYTLEEFLMPGIYDYPPLFHYLVALFPESWHLGIERWSSAVCDALHGIVIYLFSIYVLRQAGFPGDPASSALWVSFLFLISPSLTYIGSGPRAYQGTPRTLGELFFTLCIGYSTVHFFQGGVGFLLAAGLFGGLILLTSKFGSQVFVFFYVVFLILTRGTTWIAVLLLAFFTAWFFSWGHYKDILLGHLDHCEYYRKAISKRFYLVRDKNRWSGLKTMVHEWKKSPFKASRILVMDNTYVLLLIRNPQLAYLLVLLLAGEYRYNTVSGLLFTWIGAGVLAFLLTSLRPFLFLGEAERYLEYALFPQLLLISLSGSAFPFFYWLAGYEMVLYGVFVAGFIYQYSQKEQDLPMFREMIAFIRRDRSIQNILPIYLNDAIQLAYESGKRIAHFPGNFRNRFFPIEEFLSFYDTVYPFPNQNLRSLMDRYGYDAVYFSKQDMHKAIEHNIRYTIKDWELAFVNTRYTVLMPPRREADAKA
jgi:hypothetical protein